MTALSGAPNYPKLCYARGFCPVGVSPLATPYRALALSCPAAFQSGCLVIWLSGGLVFRLSGCLVVWWVGCLVPCRPSCPPCALHCTAARCPGAVRKGKPLRNRAEAEKQNVSLEHRIEHISVLTAPQVCLHHRAVGHGAHLQRSRQVCHVTLASEYVNHNSVPAPGFSFHAFPYPPPAQSVSLWRHCIR